MLCKNDLHELRSPGDYRDGECARCFNDRQRRYDKRRKLAMTLLHTAEERGLSGGEAIAVLQHADYRTLQECWNR